MRLDPRKLALVLAVCVVSLSLVGAGVKAHFGGDGPIDQTIAIGRMKLHLWSHAPGPRLDGKVVTCPTIHVTSSTGSTPRLRPNCPIFIQSNGPIKGKRLTLTLTSHGTAGMEVAKFWVTAGGTAAGAGPWSRTVPLVPDKTIPLVDSARPGNELFMDTQVGWVGLTNRSMGGTLTLTYALDLTE